MGATLEEVTNKELKDLIDSIASAVTGITGRLPGMQTCVSLVGEEKKFRFGIPVIDNINGPIAAADITAGTYDLIRIRNGTETTIVNDGAFSKATGLIYVDITFDAGDTWNDDDAYMLIPNMDSKAKIGTTTYFLQIAPWSGMVFNIAGIDAEVAAIEAKLDNGTWGLSALNDDLDVIIAALANGTYGLPALNIDLDTIIALLGTPAGASMSADIAAVEAKVDHSLKFTGTLWFVDGDNGNDANLGTTPDNAFATIGAGISAAGVGDRITVMAAAAAYDENGLDVNKVGLELVCEHGVVINNSTPGTVLVVSANYARVFGAIPIQAGQTGLHVTGSVCSIEECLAANCNVGFDIDGFANTFKNCKSNNHATTGFDISDDSNSLNNCIAVGDGSARGFYLSHANAGNNTFIHCQTANNGNGAGEAGYEVVVGADNNIFSFCSMSDGDRKVDAATNNTWSNFSEGSQIVAGQSRDQDLKDIFDAITTDVHIIEDESTYNDTIVHQVKANKEYPILEVVLSGGVVTVYNYEWDDGDAGADPSETQARTEITHFSGDAFELSKIFVNINKATNGLWTRMGASDKARLYAKYYDSTASAFVLVPDIVLRDKAADTLITTPPIETDLGEAVIFNGNKVQLASRFIVYFYVDNDIDYLVEIPFTFGIRRV